MKQVGRESTAPELVVRRFLHAQGLRFSLHPISLPGKPDIVLPRRGTVVFVHGCFWHGHGCKHGSVRARTNARYWAAKIADNRARDRRQSRALRALGWNVAVVWECECASERKLGALASKLLAR
jgi:DNA mismatch endonuclease, patch repair protein